MNHAPGTVNSADLDVPMVSIIIPTFNRKKELLRLLGSIAKLDYPVSRLDVIVVDDHSQDGTMEEVKVTFPNVRTYRHDKERWVSAARNTGISNANGDYLLFIDDDNVMDPECVKNLISTFENPDNGKVGLSGPLMYYLKKPETIWCAGIRRNMLTSQTTFIGRNELDEGQFTSTTESDDFPNCFMISRESFAAAGPFDHVNFPISYEESDIARRINRAGFRILFNPAAKVWHDIEPPMPGQGRNRLFHLGGPLRAYYMARNRIIFHRKYSNRKHFAIFVISFLWLFTVFYLRIILLNSDKRAGERIRIASGYLRGVVDGLSNRVETPL
ncbi:MAG TPA: glycosyltransferase family 2 protein [Methanomassiliicoccales archaeon]